MDNAVGRDEPWTPPPYAVRCPGCHQWVHRQYPHTCDPSCASCGGPMAATCCDGCCKDPWYCRCPRCADPLPPRSGSRDMDAHDLHTPAPTTDPDSSVVPVAFYRGFLNGLILSVPLLLIPVAVWLR